MGLVQGIQNSQCNGHINRMKRKTMCDHLDKCRKSASQNPASVPDNKELLSEPKEERVLSPNEERLWKQLQLSGSLMGGAGEPVRAHCFSSAVC